MIFFKHRCVRLLSCVASGLLVAMCYPGFHTECAQIALPLALIPLFYAVFCIPRETQGQIPLSPYKRSRSAFCHIWLFGFAAQCVAFFWISKPIIYFSNVPAFAAYALCFLICALEAIYFAILFSPLILFTWVSTKNAHVKIPLVSMAFLITLLEIIIPRFFNVSFGSLMFNQTYVSQMSSLFGFNTLSPAIFFTNLSFSMAILFYKRNIFIKTVVLNAGLWAAIFLFGMYRIQQFDLMLKNSPTTRVAYVQPNFTFNSLASLPLPSQDSQIQNFDRLLQMSVEAIQKSRSADGKNPDLLVWPESTAPNLFLLTATDMEKARTFSAQYNVPILVQMLQWKQADLLKYGLNNAPLWSSSGIVNKDGVQKDFFQKWVPMPFGEEFPLERTFPILGEWYRSIFSNASKLEVGTSYNALPYKSDKFVAPLICFDSMNKQLPYLQAKLGKASVFVNQANFVWMVNSNAGLEFSMLDRARAVENGRSFLLSANTGPTIAFDPVGRIILPSTQLLTQSTGFVDLPVYTGRTLFSYVYHWPLVILGMLSLLKCFAAFFSKKAMQCCANSDAPHV